MYPHLLKIQITIMFLVATGNCLLASSIGDPGMALFSVFAILIGFIVVDRLGWVDLSGWVANLVLIGVLYFTMRDFVGANSSGKLLSVANLLAYLQLTLYFQKKTPRLCWQLILLGILQVVLAAIFNLNFEHTVFFLLYFLFVTVTLYFQHDYQSWNRTVRSNQNGFKFARSNQLDVETQPGNLAPMLVLSRPSQNKNLATSAWMAAPWLLVSAVFAMILFHSLPHSRQNWRGPSARKFQGTGKSVDVNVDVDGIVPLSNRLQFRAKFSDMLTKEQVIVQGQPYFRGMALSKLKLENNITNWVAPYDHIFEWSYRKLPSYYATDQTNENRQVELEVILEPVSDPLLYATTPSYKTRYGETDVEFCRPISALTRRRLETTNNIASYVYRTTTLLDENDRPLPGWPYQAFAYGEAYPTLETGSPEFQMLTEIDRPRYQQLISIADSIDDTVESDNPVDLCEAMLAHFSQSDYQYTVDYRDVEKDKSIDPIEDFVRNHRQGHCTMFASALTLMLRSQGIPARYVIGFHGGSYNNLTDCYVIHGRHSHAWVEAYVPPEFCTQQWVAQGAANPRRGMWLTLDPTPPFGVDDSNEALDLARSIWQDYVISPDGNKQAFGENNSLLRKSTNDTIFGTYLDASVEFVKKDRRTQAFLLSGFLLAMFLVSIRNRSLVRIRVKRETSGSSFTNSWISRAVAVFSPTLAQWIDQRTNPETVPFYVRLEKILTRNFNLVRDPALTQREFARLALAEITANTNQLDVIEIAENVLQVVTDAFYKTRFAATPLDKSTTDNIENQLQELEQILKQSKSNRK